MKGNIIGAVRERLEELTAQDQSKREGEKGAGAVLFRLCVARVGCLIWGEKST